MITSKTQNDRLVKALATSGSKKEDYFSYSSIVSQLNTTNKNNISEIIENYVDLVSLFETEKVLLAQKIGVERPKERKTVIDELAKYRNKNIEDKEIGAINDKLKQMELFFKLSPKSDLNFAAKKSFSLNTGLKNLKYVRFISAVDIGMQYAKKHIKSVIEDLASTSEALENILAEMSKNPTDLGMLDDVTTSTLKKIGYPEIAIKDKDPGHLTNIIFREMVGAKAVMRAKTKFSNPTDDQISDEVALIAMEKLK